MEQANNLKLYLEPRYECPICLTCLKDPILTSCGHRFCEKCIHQWLKKENSSCPIDGHILSLTKDLFPDNFTRREISQQMKNCPVDGCSQLLPLPELEKHMSDIHKDYDQQNECLTCNFHAFGCNIQLHTVQQLNAHLSSQLHHHLALLTSAISDTHKNKVDIKVQESQLWEPRPKDDDEEPGESWKNLLKSLYERIVLLEQSNREQEIQITSLRSQISRITEETENLKYNIQLQFCNGICIWTVDRFQEKYLSMTQDQYRCFYSPDFTTSYAGYKFCARLKLSVQNPNYLSLLIHLKQGDFDKTLEWPFSGRISFTLVHPQNPEQSIKETMMSRPELEAFKQPSKDISPRGFGYSEFVLISDIMAKGFLENDSITIKIKIQTV